MCYKLYEGSASWRQSRHVISKLVVRGHLISNISYAPINKLTELIAGAYQVESCIPSI